MLVIEEHRVDIGKARRELRRLARRARPQQIEITRQLLRTMHDPRDLTDHDGAGTSTIQGREHTQRREPHGVVTLDRSDAAVGIIVRDAARRARPHVLVDPTYRDVESVQRRDRHRLRNRRAPRVAT